MKRFLLIGLFCFIANIGIQAQIKGGFYIGTNSSGVKYIYFQGVNNSAYNLAIKICATNEILNQRLDWNLTLLVGNNFTISPNDGWTWQKGEKLWIQYSNGQYVYWINSISLGYSPPSFTGNAGKYCRGDHNSCPCPGYEPLSRADWHCKYCGHVKSSHKF